MQSFRLLLGTFLYLAMVSMLGKLCTYYMYGTEKVETRTKEIASHVDYGRMTYIPLDTVGEIIIEMKSCEGSVDVYLSSKKKPTASDYDYHLHPQDLDNITITKHPERPIYMGIFGMACPESVYNFTIYFYEHTHPFLDGASINTLVDRWMDIGFLWGFLEFVYTYFYIRFQDFDDIEFDYESG